MAVIDISGFAPNSITDGPGLRFTVFCQGCPHGCKGCHNVATHDFSGGYDCEMQKILDAIDDLDDVVAVHTNAA